VGGTDRRTRLHEDLGVRQKLKAEIATLSHGLQLKVAESCFQGSRIAAIQLKEMPNVSCVHLICLSAGGLQLFECCAAFALLLPLLVACFSLFLHPGLCCRRLNMEFFPLYAGHLDGGPPIGQHDMAQAVQYDSPGNTVFVEQAEILAISSE